MKLNYDRKSKDPTYFIQMGIRNGKKTTTKNIKRIGKHSELLTITSDPLAYAKEQVEKCNEEHKKKGGIEMSFNVDFNEKITATGNIISKSTALNIGYFILQKIYQDLKLKDFFHNIEDTSKVTFECNTINRFLSFARILAPQSKRGTFDKLDSYYEQPSFDYQHILRFMDILEENFDDYLEHLFTNSGNVLKRNTSVCYFDCTNYYFESAEDGEYVDEVTGEILKGLRRYGPSKQHQPKPIVQMGLFMDGNGIPISMCINPGSDNEQKCALPLERKITKMFKGKQFVYCADAGLGSFDIRKYNSMGGRSFIVTQSIKKLSVKLQEAVFNDYDYRRLSDNAPITIKHMKEFDRSEERNLPLYNDTIYKIVNADRAIDVGLVEEKIYKNGKTKLVKSDALLKQRIIITFSRKAMEYQRHIRNGQIERAKKILSTRKVEDVKKGAHDVTRFIKRTSTGKSGERASDHYEIDQSIIEKEEKYDGYYAIATNLEDDAKSILEINSRRYKIEDCFRVLKTNFQARPVYHRDRKRIIAHFMTCYTALLIYRLLETKLDQYGTHFTTEEILTTLQNMNVVNTQEAFYTAAYTSSQVCTSLNGIFDLGLDKKYYLPKDLNKKIKKLLK